MSFQQGESDFHLPPPGLAPDALFASLELPSRLKADSLKCVGIDILCSFRPKF